MPALWRAAPHGELVVNLEHAVEAGLLEQHERRSWLALEVQLRAGALGASPAGHQRRDAALGKARDGAHVEHDRPRLLAGQLTADHRDESRRSRGVEFAVRPQDVGAAGGKGRIHRLRRSPGEGAAHRLCHRGWRNLGVSAPRSPSRRPASGAMRLPALCRRRGLAVPSLPQDMASQDTTQGPALTGVDFEVDRFEWTSVDRLEIAGRWFGVRGRRFVRPVLNVRLPGGRRRLIALLEHKPWAPDEGEAWIAAFAWEGEQEAIEAVELEVGSSLVVDLPAPRGGTVARPARAEASALRLAARSAGQREELETLRAEARKAARLRADLTVAEERIERLEAELERAVSAVQPALAAERDAALSQRDAAHSAREEAVAETEAAVTARAVAVAARDVAVAERDEALATPGDEIAAARAERDEALERAEAAERSREALAFERDQALA